MRAYVAGPMRGIERWNFPAFDAARDRFLAAGWEVVNPADLDREIGVTEDTKELPPNFMRGAMKRDLTALCDCDAIALLPGWQDSAGAAVEVCLARFLELQMLDAVTMQPLEEESVCVTAERIVSGDRRNQYGPPDADYAAATDAFNAVTRRDSCCALSVSDGIMFMLCVKLARLGYRYKLDSAVDMCGYARCLQLVNQPRKSFRLEMPRCP